MEDHLTHACPAFLGVYGRQILNEILKIYSILLHSHELKFLIRKQTKTGVKLSKMKL